MAHSKALKKISNKVGKESCERRDKESGMREDSETYLNFESILLLLLTQQQALSCKSMTILPVLFRFYLKMKKATVNHLAKHLSPASRVLMRADFNVPIKDKQVLDLNRIKSTIPTIKELLFYNPKSLVLLAHQGRPNGERDERYSLRPVLEPLEGLLGRPVKFLDDCVGEHIHEQISQSEGDIFLCENVRFHPQETGSVKDRNGNKVKSNPEAIQEFRKQLSRLGDVYVNDAFGTAHRAHSSVAGIGHKYRVAGRLLQRQIQFLSSLSNKTDKRLVSILGGSKVGDKIKLIQNLIDISHQIILAGGMSYPFIRHLEGLKLGSTKVTMPEDPHTLQRVLDKAKEMKCRLHFPVDGVGSKTLSNTGYNITCPNEDVPEGWALYDIGPKSLQEFEEVITRADMIFWNGPVGVFEIECFKKGSEDLLRSVVKRTRQGALSIMGGGDTANLVRRFGMQKDVTYISTGGGASVEYIQGVELPGVSALSDPHQLI